MYLVNEKDTCPLPPVQLTAAMFLFPYVVPIKIWNRIIRVFDDVKLMLTSALVKDNLPVTRKRFPHTIIKRRKQNKTKRKSENAGYIVIFLKHKRLLLYFMPASSTFLMYLKEFQVVFLP